MSFDIPKFHILDNSPEAQLIEAVIKRENVTPQETILRILRSTADTRSPAQRMIGLFSSDEDSAVMDSVMDLVAESRQTQTTRAIGL